MRRLVVTFETLLGRLRRLRTLAEAVQDDEKVVVLDSLLLELGPKRPQRRVSEQVLSDVRGRLITGEPSRLEKHIN